MGLRVFLFVDLFSGPGCSPKSSQYTVLVSRRLNPEEKRGTRTRWLPQYRERVGGPRLRDHIQEEQWQRASQAAHLLPSALGPVLGDALCRWPWKPRWPGYGDNG